MARDEPPLIACSVEVEKRAAEGLVVQEAFDGFGEGVGECFVDVLRIVGTPPTLALPLELTRPERAAIVGDEVKSNHGLPVEEASLDDVKQNEVAADRRGLIAFREARARHREHRLEYLSGEVGDVGGRAVGNSGVFVGANHARFGAAIDEGLDAKAVTAEGVGDRGGGRLLGLDAAPFQGNVRGDVAVTADRGEREKDGKQGSAHGEDERSHTSACAERSRLTPLMPKSSSKTNRARSTKKTSSKKKPARAPSSSAPPPIAREGLLRKPSPELFKALLTEGKKDLKAGRYESAEETFFHARMVGVLLGKSATDLRPSRIGQLEAFTRLLAATS